MNLEYGLGDIIAALALILSFYATWRSFRFKKSEQEMLEIQKNLNILMLERERRVNEQSAKADLGAAFVSIGTKKHRLKIFNKGKAMARNVKISFPEGNELIIEQDIQQKFPLETLESGQSVELIASVALNTKRKLAIELSWDDDTGEQNKVVHVTL